MFKLYLCQTTGIYVAETYLFSLMNKIIAGTLMLGLTVLAACGDKTSSPSSDPDTITFNDFEGSAGWNVDPTSLDKGRAHSGKWAAKVDKDHEFSLTFDMALGQISPRKFKKVHMEAWAFMPAGNATGILGIQVMKPESTDQQYGDGLKLQDVVKDYGKWVLVSKDFTLPDDITPAQHMRFSLWRADAGNFVLVDDVKLTIAD